MFALLAPGWLIALAALSIPVLIHLWSRRERRVIRVGSTKRIEASVQHRARRLRITEWPLLLVRMALLALLVLLLAGPIWRSSQAESDAAERWTLVSPDTPLNSSMLRLIDSLAAETDVRVLKAGFPSFDADNPPNPEHVSIWSLLREADALLPAGSSIDVVAPPLATRFSGARPTLSAKVTWHDLPTAADNHWVDAAQRHGGDSLRIIAGISRAEETFFNSADIPYPAETSVVSVEGMPPLEIRIGDGVDEVRLLSVDGLLNDNSAEIMAHAERRIVLMADSDRTEDARLVRAALETAAAHLDIELSIDTTFAGTTPDFILWLNTALLPDTVLNHVYNGATLFRDAPGNAAIDVDARIYASMPMGKAPPELYRRVAEGDGGAAEWTDGHGSVVLSRRSQGAGLLYTFYSRLDEDWSNLAYHPYWLDWMVLLLARDETSNVQSIGMSDRRRLASNDVHPLQADIQRTNRPAPTPLDTLFWFLVVALFCVENWMNTRILNQSSSGDDVI